MKNEEKQTESISRRDFVRRSLVTATFAGLSAASPSIPICATAMESEAVLSKDLAVRFILSSTPLTESWVGSAATMSPNPKRAWILAPDQRSTYFLFGLTDQPASKLAALDRSWLQPANLSVQGGAFAARYDRAQRAYIVVPTTSERWTGANKIELTLDASPESPVVNPALVIKNWGNSRAQLKVDGVELPKSKARIALVQQLDGSDLVVWIQYRTERPCHLSLAAAGNPSEITQ